MLRGFRRADAKRRRCHRRRRRAAGLGERVHARIAIVACLGFSGFSALVYQVLWTRWLGFAFGTTTEAIGCVLAVFFAGLALGNALAARALARLRRPLAVYASLELGIGLF